ncbi:MAG: DNA-directed RNA polymerase subunit omega [Deltaproteobacteria bacterium]|jgi:DNA-directed RNA polymerase subunit omega|nr:DNA-directed RNA polymerase subunit omega [Deltaproteobacteria bacterium]
MARVTIEDCLEKVENRFMLVHLAAERARQLKKGAPPFSPKNNKDVVLALREIADGHITPQNIRAFEPAPVEPVVEETYELIEDLSPMPMDEFVD